MTLYYIVIYLKSFSLAAKSLNSLTCESGRYRK
jgi:hypothetical protein